MLKKGITGENHPRYGKNHSDETKKIISDALTGEKNPMYGKNHTEKTKTIMSEAKKGQPKVEGSGRVSQAIEVTDITNNTTTFFDSMGEATRALNLPNFNIIRNYILRNQQKPYKGKYTFKKKDKFVFTKKKEKDLLKKKFNHFEV